MRCQKVGITCSGYRDLSEVTFRDESSRIMRRVKKHDQEICAATNTRSSLGQRKYTGSTPYTRDISTPAMIVDLFQPIEDVALHYFLTRCGSDEPPLSPDFVTWMKECYLAQSDLAMCSVMKAVGLASMSGIYYAPDAAIRAQKYYNQVLAILSKRICSAQEAAEDATLFIVIMLSVFEVGGCIPTSTLLLTEPAVYQL